MLMRSLWGAQSRDAAFCSTKETLVWQPAILTSRLRGTVIPKSRRLIGSAVRRMVLHTRIMRRSLRMLMRLCPLSTTSRHRLAPLTSILPRRARLGTLPPARVPAPAIAKALRVQIRMPRRRGHPRAMERGCACMDRAGQPSESGNAGLRQTETSLLGLGSRRSL